MPTRKPKARQKERASEGAWCVLDPDIGFLYSTISERKIDARRRFFDYWNVKWRKGCKVVRVTITEEK